MKKKALWLILAIALASPLGAFAQTKANDQDATKSQSAKQFKMDGVVKSVDPKEHKLTVDHKDIPGFMAAMTMPYSAGKTEDLTKVAAGDHITADVVVTANDTHLENIKKVTSQASTPKDKQ